MNNKIIEFVKRNKTICLILGLVVLYLAWKNRRELEDFLKKSYGSISEKLDTILEKTEE